MKKKYNIVFILADDLGSWALNYAGNTDVKTPAIDHLAHNGIAFENFFCVSPVCSPARASILTGTIPSCHGVHDWLRGGNMDKSRVDELPEAARARYKDETEAIQYLDGLTTYTDILSENGYTCALSGKWHLGDSLTPQNGFSRWYTIGGGGCNYYSPDIVENGKIRTSSEYITDLVTADAVKNITELSKSGKPYYLSVHYTAPHSPWDEANHPKKYVDMYRDCECTATPDLPLHPWQQPTAPHGTGEKRKELLRGYYAAITAMDDGIARITEAIKNSGEADNTLVIFTSDNGMNLGQHGIWGKGNGTFPQNMFDTSVKVPFVVYCPSAISPQKCSDILSHYDIFPTLMDYLGLEGDVRQALPGKSFAALLDGESLDADGFSVVFDEYGAVRMIRTTEYKYVHRYPYGPNELYNLADDPNEDVNIVNDERFSDVKAGLKAKLDQWFYKYTNPAVDGTKEPVTGMGQFGRVGVYSNGKTVHAKVEDFIRER